MQIYLGQKIKNGKDINYEIPQREENGKYTQKNSYITFEGWCGDD